MKKLFYSSLVLFVVLFVFSCKKDTTPVSPIPSISFASFSASDDQNAVLTFNFTDGDGDIGVQPSDTSADC